MATKEAEIEAQEVKNWVTGSFLTEDPSVARSAFGPNRVIAYMYKGEPPEKEMITQKEQVDQMKRTRVKKTSFGRFGLCRTLRRIQGWAGQGIYLFIQCSEPTFSANLLKHSLVFIYFMS